MSNKKKDDLEVFYETLMAGISIGAKDSDFPNAFYKAFRGGSTKLLQKNIEETTTIDDQWIKVIEKYIPSLNKIVNDYKVQLKVELEVVAIERAKKINSESVRQLAQNSHQIREVRPGNRVVPKRILTQHADIDSGLYENRFIMTLIDRTFWFVHERYNKIKGGIFNAKLRHLAFESEFPLEELDVEIAFDLKLKEKGGTNKLNHETHALFERIEYIQKVVNYLYTSNFYKEMSKLKKIVPPIIKTQVILKNTDYQNAYLLWLFLDKVQNEGYTTSEYKENNLKIDVPYQEDLSKIALVGFSTVLQNQNDRADIYDQLKSRKYRRKKEEVIKDRQNIEVEGKYQSQTIELNEAFLSNLKEHFKKSIEIHQENTKTYETALKRSLRDMIDVSNSLYESFFALDGEADIYQRLLLEDKSDNEKLKDARARVYIARMIRETKAVDYNRSVRLEKRWIRQVENNNKSLLRSSKARIKQTKTELDKQARLKRDLVRQKSRYRSLTKKEQLVAKHKEDLKNLRLEANSKISELRKTIRSSEAKAKRRLVSLQKQRDKEIKEQISLKEKQTLTNLENKHKLILKKEADKKQAIIDELNNKIKRINEIL